MIVEIVKIVGILALGITFMICWTCITIANKKYKKEK